MLEPYFRDEKADITIYCGDCFDVLPQLELKSVDAVISDPPYQITACEWDTMPDLDELWEVLKPLGKDDAAYVFTASQPFTSKLVMSNLEWFKYEWVWEKHQGTNPTNAKIAPLKSHENIVVFCAGKTKYNPQMEQGKPYSGFSSDRFQSEVYGGGRSVHRDNPEGTRYPKTVIKITRDKGRRNHPTQKPVALMEYFIRTYTNEGDLILDPFMGSGTTLVAAKKLGRKAVGIEISRKYCDIGKERLENTRKGKEAEDGGA